MTFPVDRPVDYDPDKVWDDTTGAWYAPTTAIGSSRLSQAGGRYKEVIIVISESDKIYFGGI